MKAYFSCGAGDFIAIESFLSLQEKKNISEFWLYTRAANVIRELILMHPIWKSRPVNIPYTSAEIRGFGVYAFFGINHLREITKQPQRHLGKNTIDYSGEAMYPAILGRKRKYTESLFEVEEIQSEIIIDPVSDADDRLNNRGRNLTSVELANIYSLYDKKDVKEIGIGKTQLGEALSLIKGCERFYGVDSMASVWAARQNIERIVVKTVNPIYKKWRPIYDPFSKIKVLDDFREISFLR